MGGENFAIEQCGHVPNFLKEASTLSELGDIAVLVKDIEGCYPNMPKDAIRSGLRDIVSEIEQRGHGGVIVPKFNSTKPCTWARAASVRTTRNGTHTFRVDVCDNRHVLIPFNVMIDVMEFALDHAIVEIDGQLWRQAQGIPMGDPISPGMTIGACGWMEKKWMQTLDANTKQHFKAKRYMDDIICVYAKNDMWNHSQFVSDLIESKCYSQPLRLEDGTQDTFLETSFEIRNNQFRWWLKNDNKPGDPPSKWRYSHWNSHAPFLQKRGLLQSCLRKVAKMSSDKEALKKGAMEKFCEFRNIQKYPLSICRGVCTYLGATTGERTWIDIRSMVDQLN